MNSAASHRDLGDWTILAWVICIFSVCLFFVSERQPHAERDFVYFYSVGRIASQQSPEQIYNFDLQLRTFQQVYRLEGDRTYGPSPYPPFVALFFRPFSFLPFETAFHLWQACSVALFCGAMALLAAAFYARQRLAQSLIFAAAFSFAPFLADTLLAGQLAAIGLFAFSFALFEQAKGRAFRSGIALSLALYKPTLLLLLLPMLLARRQWRALAGVLVGTAFLFAMTVAFFGFRVWAAYAGMLASLSRLQARLDFSRYVDAFAFSTLLAHNRPLIKTVVVATAFTIGGFLLLRLWIRSKDARLVWTATITWTLFLNVYVPIYDAVLILPAMIASAPTLIARYQRSFTAIALLIFGCAWPAELVACATGVQIFSITLLLLGLLQIRLCENEGRDERGLLLNEEPPCVRDMVNAAL
jgi:hypothetical protein